MNFFSLSVGFMCLVFAVLLAINENYGLAAFEFSLALLNFVVAFI